MASGSGKDQDDIQDPVHGHGEESNAAATAAELPPPAPSVACVQEQAHDRPGDGGESPSAAAAAAREEEEEAAAAAAERKGKKVVAPSPTSSPPSSAGSSPPTLIPIVPVTGAGESSSVAAADSVRRAAVSWREPLVADVLEVPGLLRPIDLKDVFDTMVQELKAVRDLDRQSSSEEKMKQPWVKQPTVWPEHRKKTSLWSKVKGDMINMLPDRIGRLMRYSNRNSTVTRPHVDHQKIPMTGIIEHYELLHLVAAKGVIFHSNALLLRRAYSEFRPVLGDGECFYRSFIFSYLEQVLDRPDTHEEHRLLAAVKGVARQHARLGWTSDFSSCRKAFKKLIKKVMRWKRHSRWKHVPSTNSYHEQKLLEFFSGHGMTEDIFAFLRLVAAIWICSHSEEYEPRVSELREDYTLKDWCFREVIQQRVFTDHVQITAVVTALGVPLRVEYLFQGNGQDLYTGPDPQEDTPRSTCWPRLRHLPSPGHEVPRVTVLYTNAHYDIIYPHRRDGLLPPIDESCSQQTAQGDSPSGESPSQQTAQGDDPSGESPSQQTARGDSCSGETSSQQIAQVESSTGESSNQQVAQGESSTVQSSTAVSEFEQKSIPE